MYLIYIKHINMYICNMQYKSLEDLGMHPASGVSELEVKWENFHYCLPFLIKFGREGILRRRHNLRKKSQFSKVISMN